LLKLQTDQIKAKKRLLNPQRMYLAKKHVKKKEANAMPQLDKVTFFSQFLWLVIIYVGFYLLILKSFLPKLGRILKVRQKKIFLSQQGSNVLLEEREKVGGSLNTLIEQGASTSKRMFQDNLHTTRLWLDQVVKDANQTTLRQANEAYVASLGERTISQNLVVDLPFVSVSGKGFLLVLTNKIKATSSVNLVS
jgi:F-type H+-transporting ATPase subunit b